MKTISLELKVGLIAGEVNIPKILGVVEERWKEIAEYITALRAKYEDDSKVLSNILLELDDAEIPCAFYMLGLADGVETEKDAEKERKKRNGKTRKKAVEKKPADVLVGENEEQDTEPVAEEEVPDPHNEEIDLS